MDDEERERMLQHEDNDSSGSDFDAEEVREEEDIVIIPGSDLCGDGNTIGDPSTSGNETALEKTHNAIETNLNAEERKILRRKAQELSAEKKLVLLKKRKICGLLEGCDSVDNYQKLNKIHEGVYGVVYRASDKLTGEIVAIKKSKIERSKEKEGFPITSIREFNILMALRHENIVGRMIVFLSLSLIQPFPPAAVKRVVMGTDLDSIFMIMEYMEHELKDVIENHHDEFDESHVKSLV